jgi:hypothetical protein
MYFQYYTLFCNGRLIDQFTEGSEIWDNVIVVVKQSMNPDDDARGPLRVAMEYDHASKIQVRSPSENEICLKMFPKLLLKNIFNHLFSQVHTMTKHIT